MIFYFTGTGNSRYIAREIAKQCEDEVISINDYIKYNKNLEFNSDRPLVFVLPIYGFRIPRIVKEFILKSNFSGNNKAYFISNLGGSTGTAKADIEAICLKKGFDFSGYAEIIMPDNYSIMFKINNLEDSKNKIRENKEIIETISKDIEEQKRFLYAKETNLLGNIISNIGNPLFYLLFINSKGFKVSDNCTNCKKCEKLCPTNCIKMVDNKPSWTKGCVKCCACLNACPVKAISNGKSNKSDQYYLPSNKEI